MLEATTMRRENLFVRHTGLTLDKKTFAIAFLVCARIAGHAHAQVGQNTVVVIAPEPVGSGARALGQSAFIAVADDATAASWNPAGLINLERPEASFVGAWRSTNYDYSSTSPFLSIEPASWDEGQINFMSFAYPLKVGNKDLVLSVNYHQVYDFRLDLDATVTGTGGGTLGACAKGAVSAYSFAGGFSMPFCPQVSLGASFNWYTRNFLNGYAWQTKTTWNDPNPSFERTDTFDDFRAYNFTFGLLWDIYEKGENLLTFGLVFHTPFTARVDHEREDVLVVNNKRFVIPQPLGRLDMDFPLSLGAGVNYRFSDRFSMAFDMDWTQWSQFKQTDHRGNESRPIGNGSGDIADTDRKSVV
jgi:long-subunit fatty acid transport protein